MPSVGGKEEAFPSYLKNAVVQETCRKSRGATRSQALTVTEKAILK